MKNLKKVLSLVLALAMALSLMTVAFATDAKDFADGDKITNTEAVSVLSALNVINGKSNNLFDPAGTVTRAEMAKMITIIALGDVDVSAFKGTKTNLKDATGWAEAYVKYCYSQGVISGRGNGIFDPNANVTASEAAKMLLVAIGYNAKVQVYEGANWAINVTRDAQISGFFKDLTDKQVSLAELTKYPLISLGKDTKSFEFFSSVFSSYGLPYKPDIEAFTADQILPMVEADLGIGFVPEEFLREGDGICRISLKEQIPKRNIVIIKRKEQPLSVAAKELERMIKGYESV